ncbi:MAG TPA: hypothetical protein VF454_04075 [Gemmatimonadales bacterium]
MSPSLEVLLSHYRQELAALIERAHPAVAPACPPGEELLWAEAGEVAGWLSPEEAMEIRRVAVRTRFYERRAQVERIP